jgi:hypothetical protein
MQNKPKIKQKGKRIIVETIYDNDLVYQVEYAEYLKMINDTTQ